MVERLEACTVSARWAPWSARGLRTFVAVDEGILDDHGAPVRRGELLRLAARLPEAAGVPDVVVGAHAARDAQHMAGKELFGATEVGIRAAGVFVARADEHFGRGDEEDLSHAQLAHRYRLLYTPTYVVLRGRALAGECTAEEGAQEGIQHGRHSIDINDTQGGLGMRGASVLATGTGRAGEGWRVAAIVNGGAWRE